MTSAASIPVHVGDAVEAVAREAITVKSLRDADISRWDDFVTGCSEATFFHRAGWKNIIETAFGHPTYFLYAESGNEIQGVLPVGHIRSRLFGNALISTPFCVYGGIAATTPEAARALRDAAVRLAGELSVDYLELRHRDGSLSAVPDQDLYTTFRKQIDPDPEANMRSIPRKQRAMVRKGIKAGLSGELDDGVDRFYALYSESVRNLGTPVLPRKWFRLVKQVFGDACEVLTITRDGHPVSSVMSYYFRDEVLPYYGGGGHEARHLKANDFMYWELMRQAAIRGVRVFDYGRSKVGTGSYHFKKNWGFEPMPLHYEYHLTRATKLPEINPMNPKYRTFVKLWQRMPLPLSRFLGPILAKSLA